MKPDHPSQQKRKKAAHHCFPFYENAPTLNIYKVNMYHISLISAHLFLSCDLIEFSPQLLADTRLTNMSINYGGKNGYDAVVVGSGYGGSVAACRMSMAGIKVCLLEKGRKWEGSDFPTDTFKLLSASRIENKNLGVSYGPKDALFQVHIQEDSLVATACGLGGGSLINCGVMVPTPVRARRNPKWPKEWEHDWKACENSASVMLRSQNIPLEFPIAKVMAEIAEDEIEESFRSPFKLSINFGSEETSSTETSSNRLDSCLGCGNCLSGCPYNAKNSTDKTYLVSAVQAGCKIETGCQVQYVVRNLDEDGDSQNIGRRWRVHLNEVDYIAADFVVISAGVLGTAEILFQSQKRGVRITKNLGFSFSCNGNNAAYLVGSSAPLNAYGLGKKHFPDIPFQNRPGPSISSSYTSSLGFTVQSAVLPTSYPYLMCKILTYGWPKEFSLLHYIVDKLKYMLRLKASQSMFMNVMGYEDSDGRITLDEKTNKICFNPPHDTLLPQKIQTLHKISKRLGGVMLMSKYRSTSVHLLGGSIAASDPSNGVCNPNGQVFQPIYPNSVHSGLYVCDASLIPCSIGINPCLTIATVSEHVSRHLVQDALKYKISRQHNQSAEEIVDTHSESMIDIFVESVAIIKETMRGHVGGMPCIAYLTMKMNSTCPKGNDEPTLLKGRVGGYVICRALEENKLFIIDGDVDMCRAETRTPYTQYMNYRLILASYSGSRYILEGKKIMNPYLLASYGWKESTTLHLTFRTLCQNSSMEKMVNLKGELHLSLVDLLRSLITMKGNQSRRFIFLLLRSLMRTYITQTPRGIGMNLSPCDDNSDKYLPSTVHDLKTEDGVIISCRRWTCDQPSGDTKRNPVLLINGYFGESYCLPTEPNDLVRTLVENGHEIILLQSRLHPLHSSNSFTITDIGKFDIPAVIKKILELYGSSSKVHVVAHCAGGLAIHIAIMGGHVSASHIASLCCTNSSMFFRLTPSSLFKMRLPLLPISMGVLGKNTILPLFRSSKESSRHRFLKRIARLIPRYERCSCDECEVLSGIFGNGFWHENVTPTMHHWLINENSPSLPMSAFPHLRKICTAGFILDPDGENTYMIHPERLAISTLYISGGRSLLVTPETSFLANNYMRLHQPDYIHKRIVVEGFGHTDLLIGEESHNKVFPHILSHIGLSEEQSHDVTSTKYSTDSLTWGDDPYGDGKKGFLSWASPFVFFWVVTVLWIVTSFLL